MLWKHDARTVSLVINRAPHPEGSGDARRQQYCMEVLKESSPPWVTPHFLDLACDAGITIANQPEGQVTLWRDSKMQLGEGPPLPHVREMMSRTNRGGEWTGVAVSDLIFTESAWPAFQDTDAQIIIARASQVPDIEEEERVTATPIKKWNELSLDALFVRGDAAWMFFKDFPEVFLAEYWDDATQAWARRHRKLGIKLLNNHETMHRVHTPKWAKDVEFPMPGAPRGLRAVGVHNRSAIFDFKRRWKEGE